MLPIDSPSGRLRRIEHPTPDPAIIAERDEFVGDGGPLAAARAQPPGGDDLAKRLHHTGEQARAIAPFGELHAILSRLKLAEHVHASTDARGA